MELVLNFYSQVISLKEGDEKGGREERKRKKLNKAKTSKDVY